MFGFEKKKKPLLDFDLQKDIEDPKKQEALMKSTEKTIAELKQTLRSGSESSSFDKLGELLQGYSSLLKVLNMFNKN